MFIFDAHLDLAWNAIDWNRDLLQPVAEIRASERGTPEKSRGQNTVSFPELRQGRVVVFIATLLARLVRPTQVPSFQRYSSMQAAHGAAHAQLAYYRSLVRQGTLRWITDWPSLSTHIEEWQKTESPLADLPFNPQSAIRNPQSEELPLGFILSMEGADPILSPDEVPEWWQAGLRIIGPAHYGVSPYAHGTGTEGGLFPKGPALLRAMEKVGMILDVTHLSDQSFDEALDVYGGPVLASHHNCRALVPGQRQLSDEQIKRLLARSAVIGTALDNWMLHPGWVRGESCSELVPLASAVDHIDRICQLAGNARHAALGTDLDGGFGKEQSPRDLDTIADLQKFPELMRQRGYDEQAIRDIMFGNWLRFFREAWT
jgi:membrane dipeptidase